MIIAPVGERHTAATNVDAVIAGHAERLPSIQTFIFVPLSAAAQQIGGLIGIERQGLNQRNRRVIATSYHFHIAVVPAWRYQQSMH